MRKAFVREREPLKNVIGIVDLIDSDEFRSESRVPVLIKSSAKFPNRQRVFINVSRREWRTRIHRYENIYTRPCVPLSRSIRRVTGEITIKGSEYINLPFWCRDDSSFCCLIYSCRWTDE